VSLSVGRPKTGYKKAGQQRVVARFISPSNYLACTTAVDGTRDLRGFKAYQAQ
jgi:hypothetical protein